MSENITLTLQTSGDRSVGIWPDEISVTFSGWIREHLDDKEASDEKGRTWRQQLEQDAAALFEPYMDFPLRPYWSDQNNEPDGVI